MPIKLTKNGVHSLFSGKIFFFKGEGKNRTRYERAFFLIIFNIKKIEFWTKLFKKL